MKTYRWRNPYMDLVTTKPEFILPEIDRTYPPDELARLQTRMDSFSGIIIEIGSGSGKHLIERAASAPHLLHIGFELRFKRTFRTAEKAEQRELKNLVVVRGDAAKIETLLGGRKVQGVYINFPDPWQKKQWKKHRLINPEYLSLLHRSLVPGGFFAYKTDHKEYFEASVDLVLDQPGYKLIQLTTDLHQSPYNDENVRTEFEQLFTSQNLPTYYLKAVTKELSPTEAATSSHRVDPLHPQGLEQYNCAH